MITIKKNRHYRNVLTFLPNPLIASCFAVIEENVRKSAGKYAVGDDVTLVRLSHTE